MAPTLFQDYSSVRYKTKLKFSLDCCYLHKPCTYLLVLSLLSEMFVDMFLQGLCKLSASYECFIYGCLIDPDLFLVSAKHPFPYWYFVLCLKSQYITDYVK